ncbi:MAG TPA: AMIN domain-containing protein [Thiotrichales bacterium]|nr:AMIN domain-containing protein [Thiotrichales bacterium]
MARAIIAWILIAVSQFALAGANEVLGIRVSGTPGKTRVVLDLSGPADHRIFTLRGPERVVIDLPDTQLSRTAPRPSGAGLVKRVRSGVRNGTDLRLVLDLNTGARPKSFLLPPADGNGHRLVIDLAGGHNTAARLQAPVKTVEKVLEKPRDLVIAVDAGHGGKDPGARGRRAREKEVVLAVAKRVARLIDAEPGMRAVLVRDGDYFLHLRERIRRAHKAKADLFVSIHADAFTDRRVRGSSVYVLSRRGASSEMARLLARQENAADLVGGVSLRDKDDLLKKVLLDLSQSASIEESTEVASEVLRELRRIGKVHKRSVQKAGFVVLKSPDIPSILVETAFISNPTEEKNLLSSRHQQKLARAIFRGIRAYFLDNPPPGTLIAMRAREQKHVIRRGDTLSAIAQRYAVSLRELKVANGLTSDRLRVGQVLRIPRGS